MKNLTIKCVFLALFVMASGMSIAQAAEDLNTGTIEKVGKVDGATPSTACMIQMKNATFPNTCPTATYHQWYFNCETERGKVLLSLAMTAYAAGKTVTVRTVGCSSYSDRLAGVSNIILE